MKEKLSGLALAGHEFTFLSKNMGYEISPPYTGKIPSHDFGRGIAAQQAKFWQQYGVLLCISNGLFADGHIFYGLTTDDDEPGLLKFNDVLNTQGFECEGMQGRIVIGSNNTDTLYYDTATERWGSCDRIGTEKVWETCETLAKLIETQRAMLRENHPNL
ncbi:YrhA family protein [Pantoea sp. FN0302]|uniref:YrhA family protein n=1 Tax=Pantoea sp. FN0302 TaxID=3418558 RepID=UPI003CF64B3D